MRPERIGLQTVLELIAPKSIRSQTNTVTTEGIQTVPVPNKMVSRNIDHLAMSRENRQNDRTPGKVNITAVPENIAPQAIRQYRPPNCSGTNRIQVDPKQTIK